MQLTPSRSKISPTLLALVVGLASGASACGETPNPVDEVAVQADDRAEQSAVPLVHSEAYASFETTTQKGDAADVYYPADRYSRFVQQPQTRYPVVVLLQGAQTDKSSYTKFAGLVAAQGFVVVVPNHFRALAPNAPPALFSEQSVISDAYDSVVAEALNPTSPIAGQVDETSLAVVGHSFGGVASILGVAGSCAPPFCTPGSYTRPAALKAAVVFGTNYTTQTEPRSAISVDTSAAPIAMIQGTLDGRSLPALGALTYAELEAPKASIELRGVNHFGITDTATPAGAVPDPNVSTVDQKVSVARVATWSTIFLRAHLKADRVARRYLRSKGSYDGSVTVQQSLR